MVYARLITWQTTPEKNKGYKSAFINRVIKNENVGHAAFEIVLPINEKTTKLVNNLCVPHLIPHFVIHHEVPVFGKAEVAHQEACWRIYFSFWGAGQGVQEKFLLRDPIDDFKEERLGRNFYNENRNSALINYDEIEIQTVKRRFLKKRKKYLLSPCVRHHGRTNKEEMFDRIRTNAREIIFAIDQVKDDLEKLKTIKDRNEETIAAIDILLPELDVKRQFDLLIENQDIEDTRLLLKRIVNILSTAWKSVEYYDQLYNTTDGDQGDQIVVFPICIGKSDKELNPNALDAKKMIKKIVEITKRKQTKYKFYYNCASAVNEVIEAGIQDEKLRRKFNQAIKNKILPLTPQIVHVRSMALAQELKFTPRQSKKEKSMRYVDAMEDNPENLMEILQRKMSEISIAEGKGKEKLTQKNETFKAPIIRERLYDYNNLLQKFEDLCISEKIKFRS